MHLGRFLHFSQKVVGVILNLLKTTSRFLELYTVESRSLFDVFSRNAGPIIGKA